MANPTSGFSAPTTLIRARYPVTDQAVANSHEGSAVSTTLGKVCIGASDISLPLLKLAQLPLVKEAVYRPCCRQLGMIADRSKHVPNTVLLHQMMHI